MAVLVTDPDLEQRLKAQRQQSDSDRYDEVWEGVYMMAPLPNDEHQDIQAEFLIVLRDALGRKAKIRAGVNVSDREDDWEFNYRGPDVVVFLPGNPAKNFQAHWRGGPDFLVEIISPFDNSRKKLPFYGKVNVREALFIDRKPWQLELYHPGPLGEPMKLAGQSGIDGPPLASSVLPLSFRIVTGDPRPVIEVKLTSGQSASPSGQTQWII